MRKNIIRLNESQLHRVIKESVKRVLNESKYLGSASYEDLKKDKEKQMLHDFADYNSEYVDDDGYVGGLDFYDYDDDDIEAQKDYAFDSRPYSNPFYRDSGHRGMDVLNKLGYEQGIKAPYKLDGDDVYLYHNIVKGRKEREKQDKANFKRMLKSADKRPLHRKGSLNREL